MKKLALFLLPLLFLSLKANGVAIAPIKKINAWFNEEKAKSERGFHRFASLATVGTDGAPHVRIIEITGISKKRGVSFFTHKMTQKAKDLAFNPQAALNIWLPKTLRQMTVNGTVSFATQEETERAWKRMPRFMKLVFMASDHESTIESTEILEKKKMQLDKTYKDDIPMPYTFVGYHLKPDMITFYEIKPRHFPIKEIAKLRASEWTVCQTEP